MKKFNFGITTSSLFLRVIHHCMNLNIDCVLTLWTWRLQNLEQSVLILPKTFRSPLLVNRGRGRQLSPPCLYGYMSYYLYLLVMFCIVIVELCSPDKFQCTFGIFHLSSSSFGLWTLSHRQSYRTFVWPCLNQPGNTTFCLTSLIVLLIIHSGTHCVPIPL